MTLEGRVILLETRIARIEEALEKILKALERQHKINELTKDAFEQFFVKDTVHDLIQ